MLLEEPFNAAEAATTPWSEARRGLAETDGYWLSTVRPDGRPHAVPVLAVWANSSLHFVASAASRKARNLARDAHCVVTTRSERLDLVVEGDATKVHDEARLQQVADAYLSKYEWPVTVRAGAFHDTEGAPTAGPPPYEVYAVTPTKAYGFPLDGVSPPTRWRFDDGSRSDGDGGRRRTR